MMEPKLVKKENFTDKSINRQKKILMLSILAAITVFLGSSYALLTNFDATGEVVTITTGDLSMTINNTNGLINLNNKEPESDTTGLLTTAISLTLTNTGNIKIGGYDVKLISETSETDISTLDENYIKYAISEDGTTYTTPSILSENNNIVYAGYNLAVNASKTIYLKLWIDENAGNNALGKFYYGSIKVDLNQKKDPNMAVLSSIENKKTSDSSCSNITVEEDGITYLSGTNDCIDFNYVWYSGKLWRITAINPDGSLKMTTDDNITTIEYNESNNTSFYTNASTNSHVYQWLTQDFLDTLYNYENIINTTANWYSLQTTDITTKINSTVADVVSYTASVGLLNTYEYYKTYQNTTATNSYLNNQYNFWLLNPYSSTNGWHTDYNSQYSNDVITSAYGIRPTINLKSSIQFLGGTGTKTNPYIIVGDKEKVVLNTTLLNTRLSGEYVKFDGDLYRIVSIDNNLTKLNKVDYLRDNINSIIKKKFATTSTFGKNTNTKTDDYFDYYLNNTWYNNISSSYKNMLEEGTYYLGTNSSNNYKSTICQTTSSTVSTKECTKTTSTFTGYVGLPRFGEMFASQIGNGYSSSSDMWLITPYSSSSIFYIFNYDMANSDELTITNVARPSINLKSSVKITGGTGLKDNPYEISL